MEPVVAKLVDPPDLRSTGRSEEVARDVLADPSLFPVLFAATGDDDPVVRLRAADAAEKVTRQRPDLLRPHAAAVLELLAGTPDAGVRWHAAQLVARLPLTATQPPRHPTRRCAPTNTPPALRAHPTPTDQRRAPRPGSPNPHPPPDAALPAVAPDPARARGPATATTSSTPTRNHPDGTTQGRPPRPTPRPPAHRPPAHPSRQHHQGATTTPTDQHHPADQTGGNPRSRRHAAASEPAMYPELPAARGGTKLAPDTHNAGGRTRPCLFNSALTTRNTASNAVTDTPTTDAISTRRPPDRLTD